ncbi:MAG: bifunctional heptose 7-phosphate kinase/heptose 1-phosphate adenyltransferase [Planctomycetes bacterium]|nr:bifunctional heptose 7-phosphate kinase/heptose 1-phosphate adenyltransferase [Planctomycetota bacterium]
MSTLLNRLNMYKPFTAMVVGDFMLDEQIYGAAERLSPDAPVPILLEERKESTPGGAANVALCLWALKAEVLCFGVIGSDREGETLRRSIREAGCDVSGIIQDDDRPTTIKRSMIGLAQHRHPQKMFRVDVESREPVSAMIREKILSMIESKINTVDVVCLEDYDKGVCSPEFCNKLVEICKARNKPLLVDPAAIEDYSKYTGATLLTPNRSEAELATGLDTPLDASEMHNSGLATKLIRQLKLEAVVLTLDCHGALLEERGNDPVLVPTVARSVYDVTGAGDIVLAALAGGVANKLPWLDAVKFANAAAGLEVEVFGAQPIPFANVVREVLKQSTTLEGKVRSLDELLVELAVHREAKERIIFTNGCFDVIHAGHVAYLREAKQLGDVLVVAINCDEQVRQQKGEGRPIYDETERLEILSEFACIDYLIVFDEPTVGELLEETMPDVYVKGGDYQIQEINERKLCKKRGIEIKILAQRPGLGSTDVIERLVKTADK